jgi:hypothetical protein
VISRHLFHLIVGGAIGLTASAQAVAQSKPQTAPPDPLKAPVKVSATIEAIDRTNRLVTLKGENGTVSTVYADENVKRFNELKVGDKITASYYESIAVQVRKPGDPAPPPGNAGVTRGTGARPSATAGVQETVTVTVQAIDKANQSVTVKKQDGGVVSFRVQDPKYLEMAKPGDTVDITYTRALLIEVAPGK